MPTMKKSAVYIARLNATFIIETYLCAIGLSCTFISKPQDSIGLFLFLETIIVYLFFLLPNSMSLSIYNLRPHKPIPTANFRPE
jgi:hypothetical protein